LAPVVVVARPRASVTTAAAAAGTARGTKPLSYEKYIRGRWNFYFFEFSPPPAESVYLGAVPFLLPPRLHGHTEGKSKSSRQIFSEIFLYPAYFHLAHATTDAFREKTKNEIFIISTKRRDNMKHDFLISRVRWPHARMR